MSPDPSLFNLVAANYGEMLFSSSMDVLNILSGQIERTILANEISPHIYLGMQTFSSFELFASHYSELAHKCQKITVFGVADKQPRQVPHTEFIAVPQQSNLAKERFVIVNHPTWQVMLLAKESPETEDRWERQRLYNGLLTFSPAVVERCQTIAAMLSGNQPAAVGRADAMTNQQHIAQFVAQTALLRNRPDFELSQVLGEVPTLADMVSKVTQHISLSSRLEWITRTTAEKLRLHDVIVYRNEGNMLRPIASIRPLDKVPGVVSGQGPVGQVARNQRAELATGASVGQAVGDSQAQTLYTMPLFDERHQALWGLIAYASTDPQALTQPNQRIPLATLTGLVQAVVYHDVAARLSDDTVSQPMNNGAISTSAPSTPAAPAAQPDVSRFQSAPRTAPATRGRIRLGPRAETTETAPQSTASGSLEVARLPQVEPVSIEEDPMAEFQRRLTGYLLKFDRDGADTVWREAYARFSARELCTNLLQPVLIAVGEGWHRGQVSVAAEHFTTSYVESKIIGFLNSYPDNPGGMSIVTGCAQGETHETGIMMLSLFFRWEGHKVIYLGANVPNSTLAEALQEISPDMLCLSATMKENANSLTEVGHIISNLPEPRPIFGFGGTAFIFFPEMRSRVSGIYLGDEPNSILKNVNDLLEKRRLALR